MRVKGWCLGSTYINSTSHYKKPLCGADVKWVCNACPRISAPLAAVFINPSHHSPPLPAQYLFWPDAAFVHLFGGKYHRFDVVICIKGQQRCLSSVLINASHHLLCTSAAIMLGPAPIAVGVLCATKTAHHITKVLWTECKVVFMTAHLYTF